jgi:cell division protein ZapA (FtsZ GTPase activity inhibitor)
MATITIDDKEYDTETLSDEAKNQLQSINFVDQELARLNAQAAVLQTARIAYAKALNDALGTDLVFNS